MGQDIHTKCFIYSKLEQCYIDGLSLTACPRYSVFGPLYDGRNYDLFSVFGSQRSDLPMMKFGNFGIPEFLPKTYKAYLSNDCDYHSFVWWDLLSFKKALTDYIGLMENPRQFYEAAENDWMLQSIHDGTFDECAYDKEMIYVQRTLKKFLSAIADAEEYKESQVYSDLIDIDKTVYLFYFDN